MTVDLARWGLPPGIDGEDLARVVAEFRGGYLVMSRHGELKAQSAGRLRRAIKLECAAKPAVGDWVRAVARPEEASALIEAVLPRTTCVRRRASGRDAVSQVVASNVDVVLIVSALDDELNLRRLERYLTVVRESGARPAIALTKADLAADVEARQRSVRALAEDVPIDVLSNLSGEGVAALDRHFDRGATVALVGSSGVGKSTLINRWLGDSRIATREVDKLGKGRHTTTHRELYLRPAGGLVMDTPGMRELGLWAAEGAVADTFADVSAVAEGCRFRDCRHGREPGCAVVAALAAGNLSRARVEAWQKLSQESATNEADSALQRKRAGRIGSKALARRLKEKE
jgi:ribosome biogenesis GTPase